MHTYYEVKADIDNETEVLYGSYDKLDCDHEVYEEREYWEETYGYTNIRIETRSVAQAPDPELYDIDSLLNKIGE